MKKGGLVFLSIILALVIIAIGASAGALAYTNGVPAIKQTSVTAENTDDNSDSGYTSEDVADTQLTKSFDQFTVDNTMSSSEDKDKKDDDSDKRNLPRIRKMQVNPQRAVKTAMIRLPTELLKLVNQKKIAKMAKTATIQRVL